MRRAVKALCMVLLTLAAIPAAVFVGILWAVFRLTNRILTKSERRNDES